MTGFRITFRPLAYLKILFQSGERCRKVHVLVDSDISATMTKTEKIRLKNEPATGTIFPPGL